MVLESESKYPTRRTYVLKLRSDAKPDALAGRLENLVTANRLEFATGDELIDSIARDLDAGSSEQAAKADE